MSKASEPVGTGVGARRAGVGLHRGPVALSPQQSPPRPGAPTLRGIWEGLTLPV